MESQHEIAVGHELRTAAETAQIPVVPAAADAPEQAPTWRTSVGVVIALVLAFVAITLVGL
ncbi:hypothetical protein [Brachybacterium saurashtrense]|uniref:Uncharacterized protein n=1 Tax=Brachybacterium saurashtrense TaxID=556288 RepID=A0A345YS36_9MICO|nr:hypothetical protein [Brachybacterium saurashtrense]AXK46738.1 hypothetical protein DWV08_14710 [Brachybacterium saurashtrense]RRR22453.1 hypothetical protein DXU92_09330 [Brachybacterium saurashtrense]